MTATYPQEAILDTAAVAAYLQCSEATVRQYCHLGEGEADRMPNFRLGTHIRIPFWGLVSWISRRAGCPLPSAPTKGSRHKRLSRQKRISRTVDSLGSRSVDTLRDRV